ncbi:MAG: hypothetical protein WC755_04435 [Candidatus Woesearchaeota archaeon]|jgi:hypothetical protein
MLDESTYYINGISDFDEKIQIIANDGKISKNCVSFFLGLGYAKVLRRIEKALEGHRERITFLGISVLVKNEFLQNKSISVINFIIDSSNGSNMEKIPMFLVFPEIKKFEQLD